MAISRSQMPKQIEGKLKAQGDERKKKSSLQIKRKKKSFVQSIDC